MRKQLAALFEKLTGKSKTTPTQPAQATPAPVAPKIAHTITQFGETRTDNYHWMRDANWQQVLKDPSVLDADIRKHLDAENAYTQDNLAASAALTKTIGDELAGRIVPTESSVPVRYDNFEYWSEYREGGNYPVYKRRDVTSGAEETIFDGDLEAKGFKFFDIAEVLRSPDHKYIAYAVDTEGSEYYDVRIRELATGKDFPAIIRKTDGSCEWSADSSTLFYVEMDDHHRAKDVKSHTLGTDTANDPVIYHENDDAFFMNISKTKSGDYILITCGDSETNETRFFSTANNDGAGLQLVRAREAGVQYNLAHRGDLFYIHTNIGGATEFKIMTAPVVNCDEANWQEFHAHRDDVTLSGIITLKDHLVRLERHNALPRVVVTDYKGSEFTVSFPDAAYDISTSAGGDFSTDKIRVSYVTMANPGVTFEVDLNTGDKKILKEKKLPNGHDPSEYVVERFNVTARDGAEVPVTLLRHKSVKADGTAPLYQYGYGSYGLLSPSGFSSGAISMVDRGVVYAVAHIRGSGDKGEAWHKDGKKATKMNTFNDFIDVTEALLARGYGKKGEVCMEGRSAGGMLMGAVVNMRPDLYGAVVAGVAFVDVLNTISDATLPLTPPEWEEWGNPLTDKSYYDLLKSYSPYDNIQAGVKYPLIIAPAGLTDPRVTYWEPAKWIARLRDEATGGPFLLKMNMGSGHFGSAARYDYVREKADEYAVCLTQLEKFGHDISVKVDYAAKLPAAAKPASENKGPAI